MEKEVKSKNLENKKEGVLNRSSISKLHFSKIFVFNLAVAMSFFMIFAISVNAGDVIVKEGSINASSTSYFLQDLNSRNITLTQGGFKSSAASGQNFIFEDTVGNDYVDIYCKDTGGNDLCEFKTGIFVSSGNTYTQALRPRGNIYNDAGVAVDILDNVTIGGNLTISNSLTIPNLASCDVKTNSNGNFYCGTDQTGGGSSDNPWKYGSNTIYNNTENVKVGIGTSTPLSGLHLDTPLLINVSSYTSPATSGDTKTDAGIILRSNSGSTSTNIYFETFNKYLRTLIGYQGSGDINIGQSSTALIDSINILAGTTGNVGINKTSPAAALDVNGGVIINNGKVGIGTSSPSVNLHVAVDGSSVSTPATGTGLAITNSGTTTNNAFMTLQSGATGYAGIQFGDNADNDQGVIEFLNGASGRFMRFSVMGEKMRITDTGYVGIGDSSPSYQLELSTDSAAKPSTNTWTVTSDERLKQNINSFTHGLDALNLINPITYRYKNVSGLPTETVNVGIGAGALSDASTATFSDPTFFNSISEFEMANENNIVTTYKGFNSHILTYVLVNAVKELNNKKLNSVSANSNLAGQGNAYLCLDSSGKPFRSLTPCR